MDRETRDRQLQERVEAIAEFDRFYERRLRDASRAARDGEANAVERALLRELSLGAATPTWLSRRLGLDLAYVSRALRLMALNRHVALAAASNDGRQRRVQLTKFGRLVAEEILGWRGARIRQFLGKLPQRQQRRLVGAMTVVRDVLERDEVENLLDCARERARG